MPSEVAQVKKERRVAVLLPLTDDRLWTIEEVAYYAGRCDPDDVRRMPLPWTTRNADPEGRGRRLYDPKEVKAYFAARRREPGRWEPNGDSEAA